MFNKVKYFNSYLDHILDETTLGIPEMAQTALRGY